MKKKKRAAAKTSQHEQKFAFLWKVFKGQPLEREYKFCDGRKWRFDFCHVPTKTAIEVEGGIWNGGRHTTGSGFEKDCEKYNKATMLGYHVIRLTPSMVTGGNVEMIIEYLNYQSKMI